MNSSVVTRRLVLFPNQQDAVRYAQMLGEVSWNGEAWIAAGNGVELRFVVIRDEGDLEKLRGLEFQSADASRLEIDLASQVWSMIRAA